VLDSAAKIVARQWAG